MLTVRHLLLAFTGLVVTGLCTAHTDDAEAVKEKLFQAKKEYDSALQKFRKSVSDLYDKREDEARKTGKLKVVDQIKAEREAFEKNGEAPSMLPAVIHDPIIASRTRLDAAYKTTAKEYLRLKLDDAVESTEKERQEFLIAGAFLYGKRTYVAKFTPFDIRFHKEVPFENDASRFKMNGESIPHSIFMHGNSDGEASVSYTLGGKMVALRTSIGIPMVTNGQPNPKSPVVFEVVGDKKLLWKSEPVTKTDSFQTCNVCIDKVKILTLRIHCQGDFNWSRAVWFGPIVAE